MLCTILPQDVKPGKARVIKCLMENMAQPNFGEDCKEELQAREDVMKTDYRWAGCSIECAVRVMVSFGPAATWDDVVHLVLLYSCLSLRCHSWLVQSLPGQHAHHHVTPPFYLMNTTACFDA